MTLPKSIQTVIDSFESLPGIGPKTAQRLAFYLLRVPQEELDRFGVGLSELKKKTVTCHTCFNIDETDPCRICDSDHRDHATILVVATSLDVLAIEKSGYKGLYHVLGGLIDPLNRVGPDDLKIQELVNRIRNLEDGKQKTEERNDDRSRKSENSPLTSPSSEHPSPFPPHPSHLEVILATSPTMEGEATAMYIQRQLQGLNVKITRIGRGLPIGSDVEYADEGTLARALEGRREF